MDFGNSNLLQTIVIGVVWCIGLIAYIIYVRQKSDEKRKAARIILMEIRKIESNIKQYNKSDIWNIDSLVWNSNRNKLNHFFVDGLDRDGMDYINSFYEQCNNAEIQVLKQRRIFDIALETKAAKFQEMLFKIANEVKDKQEYDMKKNHVRELLRQDEDLFEAKDPFLKLDKYIKEIKIVSGTVYFEKLKKIAKIKD